MTLQVGITSTINSSKQYTLARPDGSTSVPYPLGNDLLYTGPVGSSPKGVQIDVATAGLTTVGAQGHPGVVFNCNGRLSDNAFQTATPVNGGPNINPLWVRGRGIIFYPNGQMYYERWFESLGNTEGGAGHDKRLIPGNWTQYGAITVTCTTYANGTGKIGVYGTSGLGGTIQVELHSIDFADGETATDGASPHSTAQRSIPPGLYAAVFALNAGITARPRAIFN